VQYMVHWNVDRCTARVITIQACVHIMHFSLPYRRLYVLLPKGVRACFIIVQAYEHVAHHRPMYMVYYTADLYMLHHQTGLCTCFITIHTYICFITIQAYVHVSLSYRPRCAEPSGRAAEGVGLRPKACWDRGFESHQRHGCLSLVSVVWCQVEVSATD
jgi:hypothetical protein